MSNAIQQTIAILDNLEGGQFLEEIIVYLINLDEARQADDTPEPTFMIGQQVIYQRIICIICEPEHPEYSYEYWIHNPSKGYKHGVATSNLKPLPNGQL